MTNKIRYRSPKLARTLLKRMSLYQKNHSIIEDFEETFNEIKKNNSPLKAKYWYWKGTLKSILGYLKLVMFWRFTMLINYLRITYRHFIRQKLFSFINLAGLTIGLTCGILILMFIKYELSFDKYHDEAKDVYRVVREHQEEPIWYNSSEHPLAASLKQDFPEVLKATRVKKNDEVGVVEYKSNIFYEKEIYFADQDFLDIFTFPLFSGDRSTALKEPFSVLITLETAEKYFNGEEALGKIIQITEWYSRKKQNYKITGVLKNIPENSHFGFDFILSYNSLYSLKSGGKDSVETWSYFEPKTYIKLASSANVKNLEQKFPSFLKKYKGKESKSEKIHLQSLTDIHLGGNLRFELEENSDKRIIFLFSAIAFFIMLIACLNYVNLSVARSVKRANEVGVRKVLGANKNQLVKQFLLESMSFSILALLISFLLVDLFWSAFGTLIGRELISKPFHSVDMVFIFTGTAILIGFLSGSYPAFFISSFQPIQIIKKNLKIDSKNSAFFRNSLLVVQFAASIILIVCTLVIHNQINFIKNKNLGFERNQIITVYTLDGKLKRNPDPFKKELLENPSILGVSASLDLPTTIRRTTSLNWNYGGEERKAEFYFTSIDFDYFNVYDMEIMKGRNFSENFPADKKNAVVINETAAKNFGWQNPIERQLKAQGIEWQIIGVVKDFHFQSLHSKIEPMVFTSLNMRRRLDYFSIKVNPAGLPSTIGFIQKKWDKFSPEFPLQSTFLDERIDGIYKSEHRLGKSFNIFTIIALSIACMGLIGLAFFISEQKRKEISVRKILGADIKSIIFLLANEYLKSIAVALAIAWPAGYLVMNRWLKNFAYRTNFGAEIFILSGLIIIVFTLLTVSYLSIKSAVADPVKSLRYE